MTDVTCALPSIATHTDTSLAGDVTLSELLTRAKACTLCRMNGIPSCPSFNSDWPGDSTGHDLSEHPASHATCSSS